MSIRRGAEIRYWTFVSVVQRFYHKSDPSPRLASTFLLGNDSSTLWHWRNGFRLQPLYSAMRRAIRESRAPAKSD